MSVNVLVNNYFNNNNYKNSYGHAFYLNTITNECMYVLRYLKQPTIIYTHTHTCTFQF
jgi:hypothetical protein